MLVHGVEIFMQVKKAVHGDKSACFIQHTHYGNICSSHVELFENFPKEVFFFDTNDGKSILVQSRL